MVAEGLRWLSASCSYGHGHARGRPPGTPTPHPTQLRPSTYGDALMAMTPSKLPALPLPVTDLVKAGAGAPQLLVTKAVRSQAGVIAGQAARARAQANFDVEAYVDKLVSSQLRLVRAEGAGAGLAITLAEMSSTVTGPGAVIATGTTLLADVSALAYLQIQLTMRIAAAYGHDLSDIDTRMREILSLHSLEMTVSKGGGGKAAAKGSQRVAQRLLERYLRGPALASLTSMFRFVGIKFSRAALVRGLPIINVPANAAVADVTTRRTAKKARDYYRDLPSY